MPQVDPDQLAALRRLRAAFGPTEVLEVVDDTADRDQAAAEGGNDHEGGEGRPLPER